MSNVEPALIWIASIAGGLTAIIGFFKMVLKPFKDMEARLSAVEKNVESHNTRLSSGDDSFARQEQCNILFLKSLSAILKHLETGNHTGEMKQTSKELDDFLYKNSGSI